MAWTPGGPLLTLGDLLEDLASDHEEVANKPSHPLATPSPGTPPSLLAEEDDDDGCKVEIDDKSLRLLFEQTYNQLIAALGQSGNVWLGLTQKLCAALTTADKLVAEVHIDLGLLLDKIKILEAILDRGRISVSKLQSAASRR